MSGTPTPPTIVVLDTNVVSELMRSTPDARVVGWVGGVAPPSVHTTSVTLAEVRFGIARLPHGQRRTTLNAAADQVFDVFAERVLPFDPAAALDYAHVVVKRQRAGMLIGGFDAQIAAICRSRIAVLATRNTPDFDLLGLDLVNPWHCGTTSPPTTPSM